MSTNLEYRARETQRKRESRRQASEAQREEGRQKSRARCSRAKQWQRMCKKKVGDFLTGPLAHIINVCISNSYFPRVWKSAHILPVPKVDNPKQEAQYRPVSILPALSKVFERLVLKQLVHYIDERYFFTPKHLGLQERTVHPNCFAR